MRLVKSLEELEQLELTGIIDEDKLGLDVIPQKQKMQISSQCCRRELPKFCWSISWSKWKKRVL